MLSDVYLNSQSKLTLRCSCGNVFQRSYNHITQRNSILCLDCIHKRINDKNRNSSINISYIKEYINSFGSMYISGEYVDQNSRFTIRCVCGNVFNRSWRKCTEHGVKCYECGLRNRITERTKLFGEQNRYQNISISSAVNSFVRARLGEWKREIMNRYHGRCPISGEHSDNSVVHHLTALNILVEEEISHHGIDINERANNVSQSLIDEMVDAVTHRHNLSSGILISKDIHKQFHHEYGLKCTSEQFDEFIKDRYGLTLNIIQAKYQL